MKPGDKVWFVYCERYWIKAILSGVVSAVDWCNEVVEPLKVHIRNSAGVPTWSIPIDKVFPTREALCEHYRKIFE